MKEVGKCNYTYQQKSIGGVVVDYRCKHLYILQKTFLIILFFICFFTKNLNFATSEESNFPSYEGEFGKWKVFTIEQNNKKICYTTSSPVDISGNHKDNRNPYVMVSLFGNNKVEISISSGYIYKPHSIVSVSIDGKQERFIAENETIAWPEKNGYDKNIIQSMIGGFNFLVFSESYANTYSVDTYSLSGFKQAYKKIIELCKK